MRANLTEMKVRGLKPPPVGQVDYWDSRTPGFGIRISVGGSRTWIVMYRQNGRKRRLALGRFPEMGVADARNAAKRYFGQVAQGEDPAAEKAAAKAEETFGELSAIYLERHAAVHKKPRSMREDVLMLNADLLPIWRDRKLSEIRRKDVIALLDRVAARAPIHANRVRSLISTMFNFAIGRDLLEYNPAYRVPRPAPERARDRVLSEDEIRRLWLALDGESDRVAAVFRLLLLTAARRSEVLGLRWDELDLDSGWWVLPAARSKGGVEHRIPLVPSAVRLLQSLKDTSRDDPFVFRGRRLGKPVSNPQQWLLRIAKRAQLTDFRLHDIRRTVASSLTELGVPRLTVSKLLGHAEGGVTGKHYDQYSYSSEKRAALAKWARRMDEIVTGQSAQAKVVELRA